LLKDDLKLSLSNPFLALAVYPVLAYLLLDPTLGSWAQEHRYDEPMPPAEEHRTQRTGRYLWILRYAILWVYIFYASHKSLTSYLAPSLTLAVARPVLEGLTIGVLLVAMRSSCKIWWPDLDFEFDRHPENTGPSFEWILIIVFGAFAEEEWRVFCLVGIQRDSSLQLAVILTSVVFALSQLAGRPSRLSIRSAELFFTIVVGLFLAGLFLVSHSLPALIAANMMYHLCGLYMTRKRPSGTP
jgi:hypothetical protein